MIIGIAGKAASGKTTTAQHLASLSNQPTIILSLAKVLRQEVEGFLKTIGAEQFVPLLYGSQQDKVTVFLVNEARALASCPRWQEFIDANSDIQEHVGVTAVTPRLLLQWWGTDYRRSQNPDYWVNAWLDQIKPIDLSQTLILVDDIRFDDERQMIANQNGLLIKITRPGCNGANSHLSETALDHIQNWDTIINNDADLDKLHAKTQHFWNAVQGLD